MRSPEQGLQQDLCFASAPTPVVPDIENNLSVTVLLLSLCSVATVVKCCGDVKVFDMRVNSVQNASTSLPDAKPCSTSTF